jgi:CheY-like chemotaxis protein
MADALIIDDNRETADALQQMLEVLGIPSRVAYGASPAISALSSLTPRLVLLDINMPGVDGTEILAFLTSLKRSNVLCREAQSLSSSSLPTST